MSEAQEMDALEKLMKDRDKWEYLADDTKKMPYDSSEERKIYESYQKGIEQEIERILRASRKD